jgi:hypothetical protein
MMEYIKRGVSSPLDSRLEECWTQNGDTSESVELSEVRVDYEMKAVVEYWATGVRQYSSEYWTIIRNAFAQNGLGVPLQRVMVVGARVKSRESNDSLHQYTFLWIVDPKAYSGLGVTYRYLSELRPAMCGLFRLRKSENLFYDVDIEDMERSMRDACNEFPNVQFVEEYFPTEESKSKLDRKVHVRRKLEDVATEAVAQQSLESADVQECSRGARVEVARYSPPESVACFPEDDDAPEPSDDED